MTAPSAWCLYYFSFCVGGGLPAGHDESVAARTSFRGSAWPVPLHALAMGAGAVGRTGDNAGFLGEGSHWYYPLTRSA
jgi:hypothetical protein